MRIDKSEFLQSCQFLKDKPARRLPEFAFIGRSNVGKSSLINMLCNHQRLAKTSSKPGKTILINYFTINDQLYFVDLPGYGYAKLSMTEKERISKMNNSYISGSEELGLLFVLIDSRHKIQDIDMEFLINLGNAGMPFAIIYTKADKMGTNLLAKQLNYNKKQLLEYWEELPPIFVSSSSDKRGREEILNFIEECFNKITTNNQQ
ncbi:MAG: ribosome biogenesis GTP-binding protein YihA/YsxC [Candidatus Egerieousia sp.]|nr:ribosome biogenesis GTP-binding protein YihA/YsxC [bacterium]MDD5963020.1 ribosome biogenesis GTP-binding protein YihA/YsxC [bacterium]MDY5319926.1 ribosome biogenesis GTP-binding protein YihA/YsxC [Candidatus Egerieousia sp.]